MDIELDYAHRLGDVLRDMRRDLTDDAAQRVIRWATERYGITLGCCALFPVKDAARIRPSAQPEIRAAPLPPPPEEDEPNGNTDLTCHICGKACEDRRGLQGHLRIKHKIRLADVGARA